MLTGDPQRVASSTALTLGEKGNAMPTKGKYLAISGLVLQFGYLIGTAGTVVGMLRAFSRLHDSAATDTQVALASDISLALYTTAIGLAVSLVGIFLLCIALFGNKYRAPWFRIVMWILSVLWLLSFPIGTIIGVIVMIYLSNHNNEFTQQGVPPYAPQAARR